MFDIGGGELIVIVVAILILFGPKKIPEIAQMIGKGMQQFRKAQSQFQSQFNDIQSEIKSAVGDFNEPIKVRPSKNVELSDIPKAIVVETSDDAVIERETVQNEPVHSEEADPGEIMQPETTSTNKNKQN